MPHENHIFAHETPRYREWLNEVDTMGAHFLRTRVKLILDALWATGDGNEESPRDIDPNACWDNATENVASCLEDYIPPDPERCTQCDEPNRQDQDGTTYPFCRECYSDDGPAEQAHAMAEARSLKR